MFAIIKEDVINAKRGILCLRTSVWPVEVLTLQLRHFLDYLLAFVLNMKEKLV